MTVKVYSPVLPSVEVFGAHEGIASATGINQTVSLTFTPTEGTLVVVPYGDTVSQLQLEVGPTPSSHIPTEDAEVTRAADIMTVPAANMPWPEPVVIGEELVTNGTFDTDSDWTKGTGWTISGGVASCDGTQTDFSSLQQLFALDTTQTYIVDIDLTRSAGQVFLRFGPTSSAGNVATLAASGSYRYTVSPPDTGGLNVFADATFVGTVDNISVKEINPLAVSIQMDGAMTYADEGDAQEVEHFNWAANIHNRIKTEMSTSGSFTGRMAWIQTESGTGDVVVEGGNGAYSPGQNVPFSIASRHGSTFINGAVDGIALTANTTPTALPDLSTTDFEIAPDFMGNISKLRVWADDIGDDGIEEASS